MRKKLLAYLMSAVMVMTPLSAVPVQAAQMPAETVTESADKSQTDGETKTEEEIKTEYVLETELSVKSESQPESGTEPETMTTSEPEQETATRPETEQGKPTETELGETTEPETEDAAETVTESEVETEEQTETEEEIRYISEEDINRESTHVLPFKIGGTDIFAGLKGLNRSASLPETYDPRETAPDQMTEVKDQGSWNTSWAFAMMDILQNSMIRNNLADNTVDLSERHLAYFTMNTGYDALDNANDDRIISSPEDLYLNLRVNAYYAAVKLMNWHGGAAESSYPYSYSETLPPAIEKDKAQDKSVIAKSIYFIPTAESAIEQRKIAVKQMILKYGAVEWSYFHDENIYNQENFAYYNPFEGVNHEIVIVGWDDNFPKTNFYTVGNKDDPTETYAPESDGAWIVKNSFGASYGDGGYIYISYEDASLGSGNPATVVEATAVDAYDNNYFYGNTSIPVAFLFYEGGKAAQVFQVKGTADREELAAVSIMLSRENTEYSIEIYKNPEGAESGTVSNPESGERMLAEPVTGSTTYCGLYTIDLPETVIFENGDVMAIVVEFKNETAVFGDECYTEEIADYDIKIEHINTTQPGQSFAYIDNQWSDAHESGCNFRINALTRNISGSGDEDTYTVRFYDADRNLLDTQQVKRGENATPPKAPERNGYGFTGWSRSCENITGNTNIYAEYSPLEYDIFYYEGTVEDSTSIDDEENPNNPARYTIEDTPKTLEPVEKKGYIFDGWDIYWLGEHTSWEEVLRAEKSMVIPEGTYGDLYCYARYTEDKNRVRVRFINYDGTILKDERIEKGENAIPPAEPVRNGYKFKEWNKSLSNITSDTDFVVVYEPQEYEIRYYDSLEDSLIDAEKNHPNNPAAYTIETKTIELKPVEKEGYVFMGWMRKDKGVYFTTRIEQGSTGNIDLYAQWALENEELKTPEIYPVSGIVEEGTQITILSNPDAVIYYTLDGSTPSRTNGVKYAAPFELKEDKKETTVRAVAVRETETSTEASAVYQYRLTRLILEKVDKPIKVGATYTIKAVQFPTGSTRENTKWFSSDEKIATVSKEGEHCEVKAVAPGKATIIARVRNDKGEEAEASVEVTVGVPVYTVRFLDADGELMKEQKVERGRPADPPVPPARQGYEFVRWGGGNYGEVNSDLTLRAEYELAVYRITYDLGGGEAPEDNPSTYTIESETFLLKEPKKQKSFFRGWYREKTFAGDPVTEIAKGSTGDLTLYAKWFEPGGLWMEDITPQTYTGSAICPQDILVYDAAVLLTEGVDYTISYKNNVKAHGSAAGITDEKTAPVVIVKGKGNYSGTVSKNFEILPIDLNDGAVQADDIAVAYKAGKSQTPAPVVTWNGKKLAAKKDYDIVAPSGCSEPGAYEVKIVGKGNFTGQRTLIFTIASGDQKPISAVKAAKIPDQPYGKAVTVNEEMLGLKDGSYLLKMGTDYTIDAAKYTDAGTHSIIVRGKGAKYIGMRRITFKIKGTEIKTAKVDSWGKSEFTFDGKDQKPKPVLKVKGETLKENKDYTIIGYENSRNAGTAKMLIAGKGAYSGTAALSFKIKPASADDKRLTIAFASGSNRQPYEKGGTKPRLSVSFNGTLLTEGIDYTVSYKNNAAYPQAPGKEPVAIVSGKRNLTGKKSQTFSIEGKKLSDTGLTFAPDVTESTKPGKFYSTPQVFDTNGNKLALGKDYKKELVYKSKTGKVLDKTDTAKAGDRITIELTGMGAYEGTHKCTYRILPAGQDIGKAKVKQLKKFAYTGEEIIIGKNDLEVSVNGKNLALGTNYEIEPYPGNQKKGKLRFLLKGKGTYGGNKTITVNVGAQGLKWWVK